MALVVVSVLVFAFTGWYWMKLQGFSEGLTTADVIDQPPSEHPADGAIDILMVGMDSRTDAQGHPLSDAQLRMLRTGDTEGVLNTDTVILIRIPNDGKKAYGISLPRDAFVDIPGYGQHKINSAYARAKNDSMGTLRDEGVSGADLQVRSNQEGAKNLIATVQKLTGATIDHYAEVNLLGFYDITKAVGGIEVCLKNSVDDYRSGARFHAGRQTIAGANALAFVRQRHGLPRGDLDRIVRQQVFLSGMAKKVLSKDMLAPGSDTLDKLQSAIKKSVVLDKDWNVIQFAQQMINFTGGAMSFQTIPVGSLDLDTPEDGKAVEVDPAKVRAFVQGLLGKPKGSTHPTGGSGGGQDSDNKSITVNVRNGTSQDGLAKTVADSLSSKGFTTGDIGTADLRETTVVRFATGAKDAGERVAKALGGDPTVEPDANLPAGSVTVLLGREYLDSGADSGGNGLAGRPVLRVAPNPARQAAPDSTACVN